jgi:hypothetical protein
MAKLNQTTRNDQSSNIAISSVEQRSTKPGPSPKADAAKAAAPKTRTKPSKAQTVIALLRRKKGATLAELATATGWQQHSVRGLISGTIKKKLQLDVDVVKTGKSATRYRIAPGKGSD